jgi:hypothetical protein
MLLVIIQLIFVIFIEDTKYLGILFLVVIVADIFRIIKKSYIDSRRTGYELGIRDYVYSIKWISIIVFAIVLHGSLGAFILENMGFDKDSNIYRGAGFCFLFYRNAKGSGTVDYYYSAHRLRTHFLDICAIAAGINLENQGRREFRGVRYPLCQRHGQGHEEA